MFKKICLVFVLYCAIPLFTHANVLKVTSLADAGPGSLRDQVGLANVGDTVLIDVKGTINLTSTIFINAGENVTVIGPFPIHCTINVSGIAMGTAFGVAPGSVFNLMGVTILGSAFGTNGYITSDGNVLIRDCVFENNTSAANGGAVNNGFTGIMRIENSSFLNNNVSAGSSGGAIFNNNDLVLVNCTFFNNSAGFGGALFNNTGTSSVEILHCTFDANAASSASNGNAIYNSGGFVGIQNSIVVHSGAGAAFTEMFAGSGGSWMSHGGNIIRRNPGGFLTPTTGDLMSSSYASVDPFFRSGGPLTDGYGLKYLKITPGSLAIDRGITPGAGTPIPPVDCRRAPRILDGGSLFPDAGAVEFTPYTVTSAAGAGSFASQWSAMIGSASVSPRFMDFDHGAPITTTLASVLSFTATEAWMIDGYSQPGTAVAGPRDPGFPGTYITPAILYTKINTSAGADLLNLTGWPATSWIAGLNFENATDKVAIKMNNCSTRIYGNHFNTLSGLGANAIQSTGLSNMVNIGGKYVHEGNVIGGQKSLLANTAGIYVKNSVAGFIGGNIVGLTPDGLSTSSNEIGILVESCDTLLVIGESMKEWSRNVISGNTTAGIMVQGSGTSHAKIFGNYIGPDISGNVIPLPTAYGVNFKAGTSGRIGADLPGGGNVIGGATDGILLDGTAGIKIMGNYIGVSPNAGAGFPAMGNNTGISILSPAVTSIYIGNGTFLGRNYICHNSNLGIYLDNAHGHSINGNFIGLRPDNAEGGNGSSGVHIVNLSSANFIANSRFGGHTSASIWLNGAGDNNVVFSNKIGSDSTGMFSRGLGNGVTVQASGSTHIRANLISGNPVVGVSLLDNTVPSFVTKNTIGLNSTQTAPLPNDAGVTTYNCSQFEIDTNVVAGNDQDGMVIENSTNFFIRYNKIGVSSSGAPFSNMYLGIYIPQGCTNGMIGGPGGEGNVIAHNGQAGVYVAKNNSSIGILGNSIFSNNDLGISLDNGSFSVPLPNDLNDTDVSGSGAGNFGNNGQNYPVFTNAFLCPFGDTKLNGTINVDNPGGVYRLEFFAIIPPATTDVSGFGEGDSLIGFMTIGSPGASTMFGYSTAITFPAGTVFSATLSEDLGGGHYETSEFSATIGLGTFTASAAVLTGATCSNSTDGSAIVSVGGATPVLFQWVNATTGVPVAGATASTATGLAPGNYYCTVTEYGGCSINSDTVTIGGPVPLAYTPTVVPETCAGAGDGEIQILIAAGETPNFTMDVYNSSSVLSGSATGIVYGTSASVGSLLPDTYSILLIDANGCDDTLILTVSAGTDVTAGISPVGPACIGSTLTFTDISTTTIGSITSWAWDFGDGIGASNVMNPSYTYTTASAFTVQLIASNGTCSDTATTIVVINAPTASAGADDTVCVGNTYNLSSTGSAVGSYTWYEVGNATPIGTGPTLSVSPTVTTQYALEVFDGSCYNTDTMTLVASSGIDASFNYGATSYCASVTSVLPSFTASPGGYFDVVGGLGVTMNTATGEIYPSMSIPGTYQIYHSYTSPCVSSDTVTIVINPLPVVTIADDHFACYADTVYFSAVPAGGSWTGVIGLNSTTGTWITLLAGVNTYHTITYTYTNATTGCTNTDTNKIWLNALPPVTITGLTAGPYCVSEDSIVAFGNPTGGGFLLNGTPVGGSPYTYDPSVVGVDQVGYLYYDAVTTCFGYAQMNVTVSNDPPAPILGSTAPFDYCGTSPGTIVISNPTTTQWYADAGLTNLITTGATISSAVLPGGTHTIYVVNAVGATCTSAALPFTFTNYDASLITMNEPYLTCAGQDIQLNPTIDPALTFLQWVADSTMNDNMVLNAMVGPSTTHTYYIVATVPALPGCTLYDSVRVDVEPCSLDDVTNAFSPDGDGVNDSWIINGITSHPDNKVLIFNRWGDKMIEINGYDNITKVWDGKYNGSTVAAGTYYFTIQYFDDGQQKAGWLQVNY
ncbi:MAG TPA: gliding motility-associated C-terminal domain-containing protein [Flavobacteriales bacterium]|nr:gliding motility-associated C-terminal domain-containing protein [Flavobacteriales bacterium]